MFEIDVNKFYDIIYINSWTDFSDPELIFLTDGASKGVMQILNAIIRSDRDGVIIL